jgi:membrane associated rhomboid family serine protease
MLAADSRARPVSFRDRRAGGDCEDASTMIPISDDNPSRRPALVNWALILICVAVYGWEFAQGRRLDAIIKVFGFTPLSLSGHYSLGHGLATYPPWVTIFTAMFLHGGWLHLGGNMLYLWIFGNNVEDAMGHAKYALFYLICGCAAALGFAYADPNSAVPMLGASGAISGVLAAYVLLYPRARVTVVVPLGIVFYPLAISAVWAVGLWFGLQLVSAWYTSAADQGIAWWAHISGFAAGLILTPLFKSRDVPFFGSHPPDARPGPWDNRPR